jgi:hypothetical protein
MGFDIRKTEQSWSNLMKYVRSFFSKVAVLGLALAVLSLVASAQAQSKEGTAKVQALRGSAQYSEQGGPWQPLAAGKILKAGTVIKTSANSEADLSLKQNNSVVRVVADTTLSLDSLLYEETGADTVVETKLSVPNGRILARVKKMTAASKYDVQVPYGTVGIRGTDADISSAGVVYVMDGEAVVRYKTPSGKMYDVTTMSGEYFKTPANPEDQPAKPTSTPPPGFEPIKFPEFTVEVPVGAVVQVEIGLDMMATEPNVGPAKPPVGQPPLHPVMVALSPDGVPRIAQPTEVFVSPTVGYTPSMPSGGSGTGGSSIIPPPRPIIGPVAK